MVIRHILALGIDFLYIGLSIYLSDTDTNISVLVNWVWVSAYRIRINIGIDGRYQCRQKYRPGTYIGMSIGIG